MLGGVLRNGVLTEVYIITGRFLDFLILYKFLLWYSEITNQTAVEVQILFMHRQSISNVHNEST